MPALGLSLASVLALAGAPGPAAPPPLPRLQLAAGPLLGPHAHGEATCSSRENVTRCEHTGNFLGVGANLELRGQITGPLYIHGRAAVVGNVRPRPLGVHRGLAALGIGLGAYSRLAFIRIEYMFVPTFGPDNYKPPLYDKLVARDVWGSSAGMVSGGIRGYFTRRLAAELWAGVVVGPRSRRTTLSEDASESRLLVSFMASVGLAFDIIPGRTQAAQVQAQPPPPAPTSPPSIPEPAAVPR